MSEMIPRETPKIYGVKDAEKAPPALEALFKKWKDTNKPSKLAASFTKIKDLQPIHIEHFKEYEYAWKPLQGGIWGGIWLNDNIDYIHIVMATTPVVEYILNLKKKDSPNRGKVTLIEKQTEDGPVFGFTQKG
jgi:hypothetical protein